MALTDQLVSSWELDEASGNAIDSHGSYDLTETSGTIGANAGPPAARDFEAADTAWFEIADNADLGPGDTSFVISCEFVPETLDNFDALIHKEGEYSLRVNTGNDKILFVMGSDVATWDTPLVTGTRYHVIAWHDATNDLIGITVNNGSPVTVAHAGGAAATANAFRVGSDGSFACDGLMRRVRFWKGRTLTTDERTQLYNSGDGLDYAGLSSPPPADTTPPTPGSAVIPRHGRHVDFTVTEADSLPVTGEAGLSIKRNGVVEAVTVKNTGSVTRRLTPANGFFETTDTVVIDYDDATGDIADSADTPNAMASFSNFAVTNNSTKDRSVLLTIDDLTYNGYSTVPSDASLAGGDTFRAAGDRGQPGFAWAIDAAGTGFYASGHGTKVCKLAYAGSDPDTPPAMTLAEDFVDLTGGGLADAGVADANGNYVGAMCLDPLDATKLIWAVQLNYDAGPDQAWVLGRSNADIAGTLGAEYGFVLTGEALADGSGYMFPIPAADRTDFDGKSIGLGCGPLSIISRAPWGPTFHGINAADLDATTDHTTFADYDETHPISESDGSVNDPVLTHINGVTPDRFQGAAFLSRGGKKAVVIAVARATGRIWYGDGTNDGLMPDLTTPQPEEFDPDGSVDPVYFENQGNHSTGYEAALLWFDPDDYLAAFAGTINPYDVQPYAVTPLEEFTAAGGTVGSIMVDEANNRVFIVEPMAGASSTPLLHEYSIVTDGGGGGEDNPSAVRRFQLLRP